MKLVHLLEGIINDLHNFADVQAALAGAQGFVDEESVCPSYCPPSLPHEAHLPSSSTFS